MNKFHILSIISVFMLSSCEQQSGNLVDNLEEFNSAVKEATPGTTITMADGVWHDVELRLRGGGEEGSPIRLEAETPGKVIISGQSNLAFSGEYLEISGLVFKNGYTPTSEVISFKTSKEALANNSRVTNCVIDNFTNPERFDGDTWVAIYGKNNLILGNTKPDLFYLL